MARYLKVAWHHEFRDEPNVLFSDWARGGETKLDNLVLLCRRHHRFLHEGGYTVAELADGNLEFRDPWGGPIPCVPRPPPGGADRLLEGNRCFEIDARTCESGDADPMDLGLVVDALLAWLQPPLA